jgi:hypothetical protein
MNDILAIQELDRAGIENLIKFYESDAGIAAYERGLQTAKDNLERYRAELARLDAEANVEKVVD